MKDVLESLSFIATILGIPLAILAYIYQKRRDRRQRVLESYLQANDRYVEYLKLCLEHPEWDCFDINPRDPSILKTGMDVRKLTLFEILISTLESAFLLYESQDSSVRVTQWSGWNAYLIAWLRREDFRAAWPLLSVNFDARFVQHVNRMLKSHPEFIAMNRAIPSPP